MLEVYNKGNTFTLENSDKKKVELDIVTGNVMMDSFDVTHPGEYEKSGMLLEVKEYGDNLFYKFLIDGKHVLIVQSDSFEMKEEILSFFGDVDVLIITGSKEAGKVFENIEAKLVVPYGEGKDVFLNTLGQHSEAVANFKIKSDLPLDSTVFVNLEA